ncbi:Ankyrin repeat and FYVE domain-containing protein 1 [Homalodisca vitripennis]|nr:Ankyrin repeat and FYVE domain-containing protein 1 [Homalodisca vitripennis]
MKITLKDREIPVHKLVFAARINDGGNLTDIISLDWSNMEKNIAQVLIKWIYTDSIDFPQSDDFTLSLMKHASELHLDELVSRCEKALVSSVNVRNCIRYYSSADEINANTLKEHCSSLISTYWDDFTSEDFIHMSAPLLFHMFKSKTKFPLHSAIRLKREDVVFLYLVDNPDEYTNGFVAVSLEFKNARHSKLVLLMNGTLTIRLPKTADKRSSPRAVPAECKQYLQN